MGEKAPVCDEGWLRHCMYIMRMCMCMYEMCEMCNPSTFACACHICLYRLGQSSGHGRG